MSLTSGCHCFCWEVNSKSYYCIFRVHMSSFLWLLLAFSLFCWFSAINYNVSSVLYLAEICNFTKAHPMSFIIFGNSKVLSFQTLFLYHSSCFSWASTFMLLYVTKSACPLVFFLYLFFTVCLSLYQFGYYILSYHYFSLCMFKSSIEFFILPIIFQF